MNETERPRVGTGVWIRKNGKILFGLRKSKHGENTWCPPGGSLEMNEDPLDCAIRETKEEAGIEIQNVRFVTYCNDVYQESGLHYITLIFVAAWKAGEPQVMEPEKIVQWQWHGEDEVPESLFLSSRNFLKTGYNPFKI